MLTLYNNKVAIDPIFDYDFVEVENANYDGFSDEEIMELRNKGLLGKLIIPDEAKEKCDQGLVKYVGPDVKNVQVGDYVLFSGYSGTTVRLEGEGLVIIMPEDFLVCGVEPPETDIEGLYFRDETGQYWTCTYEMVTQFMRRKFEILHPVRNIKIPTERGREGHFEKGVG